MSVMQAQWGGYAFLDLAVCAICVGRPVLCCVRPTVASGNLTVCVEAHWQPGYSGPLFYCVLGHLEALPVKCHALKVGVLLEGL